jgi:membrane-associated phospholipid phosphatase
MRQIVTLRHVCGLLLLQLVLAAQPVLSQDASISDPAKIEDLRFFPLPAAAVQKHSAAGQFLRDIWTDQKAIWTSPPRMNRKQFFTLALPLAAGTAGFIATDTRTAKWLPNTPDQVKWSQRVANFGAIYTLGFVTGGMLVGGKVIHKPHYTRIGRISAEALASSVLTNYAIKAITQRERPDHGNGEGRFWSGGQSFPSGHAMNSWAVAVAIGRSPECPKWLKITSYTIATAVSISRWSAHKHFPSDILVGGVLGGLIGNYVARRPR